MSNELQTARTLGIDLDTEFHALPSPQVDLILTAAKTAKYRKPANANGSKARYYHARLQRLANRK